MKTSQTCKGEQMSATTQAPPATQQPTKPHLNDFRAAVREAVLNGSFLVPPDRLLDTRTYIEEVANVQYVKAMGVYRNERVRYEDNIRKAAENEHMPNDWSQPLRDKCHEMARDTCYPDAVALIESILELGDKP